MKEEQKIYIRGSRNRPDDVRKILEQYGARVEEGTNFTLEDCIYYIGYDGVVYYISDIDCIPEISQLYKLITKYYYEVKLPDSSKYWKTGDVLVSDNNPNEFYVFDKLTEKGNIFVHIKVVKDPFRIDNIYQVVSYFPCHKANDKELKTFYNTLTERKLSWNAYNKKLLRGNYMYFYPKNGHYYFRRDTIRCKDRATGEWYDAVLYSDANGQYVREVNDFNAKFELCQ